MVRPMHTSFHGVFETLLVDLDIPAHMIPPNPDDSDGVLALVAGRFSIDKRFQFCLHGSTPHIRMVIPRT